MLETRLRKVRYKGGDKNWIESIGTKDLKVGKVYTVLCTRTYHDKNYFILKGVAGAYKEDWFENVSDVNFVELGMCSDVPTKDASITIEVLSSRGSLCHNEKKEIIVTRAKYVAGNIYSVTDENENDYRIYVGGLVDFDPRFILAIMDRIPKIGKRYYVKQLYLVNNQLYCDYITISPVIKVRPLGSNQFWVWTLNGMQMLMFAY